MYNIYTYILYIYIYIYTYICIHFNPIQDGGKEGKKTPYLFFP